MSKHINFKSKMKAPKVLVYLKEGKSGHSERAII